MGDYKHVMPRILRSKTPQRSASPVSSETGPLRKLREKQGLSQRTFSEKTGISRGRLRRLEGKRFDLATYGELIRISKALGVDLGEMFQKEEALSDGAYLVRAGQTAFQLDVTGEGYKIVSFLPPRGDLFCGKLFVSAKKGLSSAHAPRAGTIFLQMLLGSLRVTMKGQIHEIQEGDSLVFPGGGPYTIENLLLRDSVALFLTLPAFSPSP